MNVSNIKMYSPSRVSFGMADHKDCKCGGQGCKCNPLQQVKDHTTMSGLELLAILNRPLTEKAPSSAHLFKPEDFVSEKKNEAGVVIEKHYVTDNGCFVSEYYDEQGKSIKTVYTDAKDNGTLSYGRFCTKDIVAKYEKGALESLEESIYPGLRRHSFFEQGGVDISRRFLRTYSKDDSTSVGQKFIKGQLIEQSATDQYGAKLDI